MIKRLLTFIYIVLFMLTGFDALPERELIKTHNAILEVTERSTVFPADDNTWGVGANSASIIELCADEKNSGVLLCTFAVYDSGINDNTSSFRVMKSEDGGKTWRMTARLFESMLAGTEASYSPCLFELPEAIGDMPKGTVILGGTSIDPAHTEKTSISLYKSTDGGDTFEEYAVIATGGGIGSGIWEPFFVYENKALYCFYSDETDCEHSQKLVYKKSTNGVTFSDAEDFIALSDKTARPGMLTLTKTDNGKFFAVYEVCNSEKGGAPVYFKSFDDIEKTNTADIGTLLKTYDGKTMDSAPVCLWSSAGGKNGTLFVVSACSDNNEIFVSHNGGKTFSAVKNPIEFIYTSGMGYKCSLALSAEEGRIYYVNTAGGKTGKADIEFTAIKIIENADMFKQLLPIC